MNHQKIIFTMKKYRSFLHTILAFALCALTFFQAKAQGWEQTYGFANGETFGAISLLPDGGFTMLNRQGIFASQLASSHLLTTDANGVEQWASEISLGLSGNDLMPAPGGGYYVFGIESVDFAVAAGAALIKVEASGTTEWGQTYHLASGNYFHNAYAGFVNPDGTIMLAGGKSGTGVSSGGGFLFKIADDGTEVWAQEYGEDVIGAVREIYAVPGGYLLAGQRGGEGTWGDAEFTLVRTDENGGVLSESHWGDPTPLFHSAMLTGGDVFFAAADTLADFEHGIVISRATQDGDVLWETELPAAEFGLGGQLDLTVESLSATSDGGAVMIVREFSVTVIVKLSGDGAVEWTRSSGTDQGQGNLANLFDVEQTFDGGYLAAGNYPVLGTSEEMAYLVKLDGEGNLYNNFISGKIYADANEDCSPDPGEEGGEGWIVKAEGVDFTYFAVSDAEGNYSMDVPPSTFEVSVASTPFFEICPASSQVVFVGNDETATANFGIVDTIMCPYLEVSLGAWSMRRCFENTLNATVCNQGTVAAEDASLEVLLDPWMMFLSASPLTPTQDGQLLTFDLGDIEPGDCQQIQIIHELDCDAPAGITHCAEAHVFPDSICLPIDPVWDGSSIELSATCEGEETIQFSILNTGDGDMGQASEYIVIEDNMIMFGEPFQLNQGASFPVEVPATGGTFRLEADQCPGHPGFSHPSITVEGCGLGQGLVISTGFVNQFPQDDADPFVDIFCLPNTGSYDPNDKRGFPTGAMDEHFIEPNTDLEYLIRFQNTGTDTAFTVVILDTLSPFLDPASIRPGASSHDYEFGLTGEGVASFTFNDIMLPDSNVNEALSHGFVTFRIAQQPEVELGSVIENSAAIYFDFNEPIITNVAWHTVGRDFLLMTSVRPGPNGLLPEVKVYPNPFVEAAFFTIEGFGNGAVTLNVFDLSGKTMATKTSASLPLRLEKGELPAGLYFFEMRTEGQLLGTGKISVLR